MRILSMRRGKCPVHRLPVHLSDEKEEVMDTVKLLTELCAAHGVSGAEGSAASVAMRVLEPLGKTSITPLGSVICRLREAAPGNPHLLLTAHIDEIGLVVTRICDRGFLRIAQVGGVDRRSISAARVTVHAAGGDLTGVITSTPPHLQGEGEHKTPKVEDLTIDTGLTEKQCRQLIFPGDRASFQGELVPLVGSRISGKALDDRAGCAAVILAGELLSTSTPDIGLSILLASQEETGSAGGETAGFLLDPTHVIAVDVSMALTPDDKSEKCGVLGGGPMIGIAPILYRAMSDGLRECAEELSIAFQLEVMGGRTGTDADHLATVRGGVRTALLSIPQRYMHTPVEVIDLRDLENTIRLIDGYARRVLP